MVETIVLFVLYTSTVSLLIAYLFKVPVKSFYLQIFIIKVLLIGALLILPDKLAAKELAEVKSVGLFHNFSLYYYASWPLFELTGNARASFVSVSTLVSFWCSLFVIQKPYIINKKAVFLLLNFFPDLLFFNAFSLRDISIVFLQCLFFLALYEYIFLRLKYSKIALGLTVFLLFLLRAEVLVWCSFAGMLFYVARHTTVRTFIGFLMCFPFLLYWAADYVVVKLLSVLSLIRSDHIDFLAAVYFVIKARYYRQFSDADQSGSTSAVVSPNQFESISPEFYIFIAMFTALVVTYWKHGLLVNATRLTYITILSMAGRSVFKSFRISKFDMLFFYVAISSYLIYAPLIVNGGNAFRMRLASIALMLVFININTRFGYKKSA